MQTIDIYVIDKKYQIEWAISEYFDELKGKRFEINDMFADKINLLDNFSDIAKILLSAVAGAVIQYLIDNNVDVASIFENGYFIVND